MKEGLRRKKKETSIPIHVLVLVLTVGLLKPSTGTATAELLGLAAPGIGDEEGAVVSDEDVLYLLLGLFVDVLLVVGDEGLGDALADGVDLGGVASAADADPHVDSGEAVAAEEEDRLEDLEAEDLRLYQLDRTAIDLDQTTAALAVGHRDGGLLAPKALDGIDSGGHCFCSANALTLTLAPEI